MLFLLKVNLQILYLYQSKSFFYLNMLNKQHEIFEYLDYFKKYLY